MRRCCIAVPSNPSSGAYETVGVGHCGACYHLRCGYCMPEEHYGFLPGAALLTVAELVELVGVFSAGGSIPDRPGRSQIGGL